MLPSEYLTRRLMEIGFTPSSHAGRLVAFSKAFHDVPSGRFVNVTIQVERGTMQLFGVNVTESYAVRAGSQIPAVAMDDVLGALQAFEKAATLGPVAHAAPDFTPPNPPTPVRAAAMRTCSNCKKKVTEYHLINDEAICLNCAPE